MHRWVRTLANPEDHGDKTLQRKNIVFALEQFQHYLASNKREWLQKCALLYWLKVSFRGMQSRF